jgi:hypothetical protein
MMIVLVASGVSAISVTASRPEAPESKEMSSVTVTPLRVMAGQYLLASIDNGGRAESDGTRIILHIGDSDTLSQKVRDITTFHFEDGEETLWGSPTHMEQVDISQDTPFGSRCLRMTRGSRVVFPGLKPTGDNTSGTILMWVAPDTQTVFVSPDQVLFYEKASDNSRLTLSLSHHHLEASWRGRGYGNTGDKKSAMDAREWHLVGLSWGYPRNDRVTVYRDGCYWYSSEYRYQPGRGVLEVGIGTGIGKSVSFEGLIDEVMIVRPALSNDEVAALYHAGSEWRLPFPDQFMAVRVDTSWQNDSLRFDYAQGSGTAHELNTVSSRSIAAEPAHAELYLDLSRMTTTPFDLIGAEITYDCMDPESTAKFPGVRMWECPKCRGPEEDEGHPRQRMVESVKNFQVDRVSSPLIRVFWNGGEGAYYRFGKNALNPPDRVDHVREFLDSLSTGLQNSIMLLAETAQSDESTSDFDTSLVRYMLNRYGPDRPRYYEFVNEMIYAEGWGTPGDRDSALVWEWHDGYYHTDGRCWTHMIEDTLSWYFNAAHIIDPDLKFGWFIDRQGGWNPDGIPAGPMNEDRFPRLSRLLSHIDGAGFRQSR